MVGEDGYDTEDDSGSGKYNNMDGVHGRGAF